MPVKTLILTLMLCVYLLLLSACNDIDLPNTQDPQHLFREEFVLGQMGSWHLEKDEAGGASIVPEQMIIELNAPQTIHYATLIRPTFADFVLEVDIRQITGDPNSSYGLLFRMQGPEQFYRFEITGIGTYLVERRDVGGTWTRLIGDWRESTAINLGLDTTNHLKVVAQGPTMTFYVNDILLEQLSDDSYFEGTIALDAGTFNQGGLQVAFDNIIISQP